MRPNKRKNPLILIVLAAVLVPSGMLLAKVLYERSQGVDPTVEIEPLSGEEAAQKAALAANQELRPFDGEVARTALRTREAAALALMGGVVSGQALSAGRPYRTVGDLARAMESGGLPPEVGAVQGLPGVFDSPHAVLYLRFRPEPLGVEVVSVGKEPAKGPSLLVRLDTAVGDASGAVLFRARRLGEVAVPRPFTAVQFVNSVDWQQELLRELTMTEADRQGLRAWAASSAQK